MPLPLKHEDLQPGERVYIKDADVFGSVSEDCLAIICEHPLPEYRYELEPRTVLYHWTAV